MTEEDTSAIKELDEANERNYGKPESIVVSANPLKCDHYYIRRSATVFGCSKCDNSWIDNGELQFENGKLVGEREHPQNLPLEK
ncbi:MAG: hypothetical protein C5B59_12900 [Bacteroidetes bacterium]|nr:MAG: hypothetical protein C5B59_12900 [Bacteroidota bacterium]